MIDLALARYLDSQGVIDLDEDLASGNTFLGHMPDAPDLAVMVKLTGGVALSNEDGYDEPTVQIMVRGATHQRTEAFNLITNIYLELAGLHAVTLDPGGDDETYVVRCLALQSAPADLGRDENERWLFSQNFALHVRNKTQHRK